MCKINGIHCDLYDLTNTVLDNDKLCEKYNFSKYDCIGFSTYTINFRDTIELVKRVKTNENIVILGGHHANLLCEKLLHDFDFVDFVLTGYAENSIIEFLKLMNSDSLYGVPGLCYWKNGSVYKNDAIYSEIRLDNLPYPDHDDIIYDYPETGADLMDTQGFPVSSSRGCTFRCSFCVNCRRTFWLPRSVSDVVEEIVSQSEKLRCNTVNFVDCNFFIDPKRASEIIESINCRIPGIVI